MGKDLDHDILLRWRTQITDLERHVLIPHFEGNLKALEEIFQAMVAQLIRLRTDKVYLASVQAIMNPTNAAEDPGAVPAGVGYCDSIKKQLDEYFLTTVAALRKELIAVNDFKTLSGFMNRLVIFCNAIVGNKNRLFLFNVRPYAYVINDKTKEILTTEPVSYSMILRPFDSWLDNLNQIAQGTAGSVSEWFKSQQDWKTQYLSFRSSESVRRGDLILLSFNIATVLLAFAVGINAKS